MYVTFTQILHTSLKFTHNIRISVYQLLQFLKNLHQLKIMFTILGGRMVSYAFIIKFEKSDI